MNEHRLTVPRMGTLREASELTGLSYGCLRQKALVGEIVAVRAGRKFLINLDKLVDYLNGETVNTYQAEASATVPVDDLEFDISAFTPRKGITPIRLK